MAFRAFVSLLFVGILTSFVHADGFQQPKTKAEWEQRRVEIREDLRKLLELPNPKVDARPEEPDAQPLEGGCAQVELLLNSETNTVRAVEVLPKGFDPSKKWPAVLLLEDGLPVLKLDMSKPGPDGKPTALSLALRGYVVVRVAQPADPNLWKPTLPGRRPRLGELIARDETALRLLRGLPHVDPDRIAVVGIDQGATRATWLMALNADIKGGAVISGSPRFADLLASGALKEDEAAPWIKTMLKSYDAEVLFALSTPRTIWHLVGDRGTSWDVSGIDVIRDTAKPLYKLFGHEGGYFDNLFHGIGKGCTLLEWDMAHEAIDKSLNSQGPTPLGHAPEAEPKVDGRFVNPAENGIAGWVAEMSQRPSTWTWSQGVIACKPGPDEYGWLRAPIELDDFILTLEWRVSKGGNSGVFLRSKPVDWFLPPTFANSMVVPTRGLDWPSRTGLELQSSDDPGRVSKYHSGSLYRHAAPSANPTHPAGQWNKWTIRCRGLRVEVWSNGEQVMDTMLDQYPTLRTPPLKGYFGLQNHGNGTEFRNIRYLKLDPSTTATAGSTGAATIK